MTLPISRHASFQRFLSILSISSKIVSADHFPRNLRMRHAAKKMESQIQKSAVKSSMRGDRTALLLSYLRFRLVQNFVLSDEIADFLQVCADTDDEIRSVHLGNLGQTTQEFFQMFDLDVGML